MLCGRSGYHLHSPVMGQSKIPAVLWWLSQVFRTCSHAIVARLCSLHGTFPDIAKDSFSVLTQESSHPRFSQAERSRFDRSGFKVVCTRFPRHQTPARHGVQSSKPLMWDPFGASNSSDAGYVLQRPRPTCLASFLTPGELAELLACFLRSSSPSRIYAASCVHERSVSRSRTVQQAWYDPLPLAGLRALFV